MTDPPALPEPTATLDEILAHAFASGWGISFLQHPETNLYEVHLHGVRTPRGCCDFYRDDESLHAAAVSALAHADHLRTALDTTQPAVEDLAHATNLLEILGLNQPAAKPEASQKLRRI